MSTVYTHTTEELTQTANVIKEALFMALQNDDIIKDFEDFSARYAIVVHKKGNGMLGRIWDKFRGNTGSFSDSQLTIQVVRSGHNKKE